MKTMTKINRIVLLFIFFVLVFFKVDAQEITVTYHHILNDTKDKYGGMRMTEGKLYTDLAESIYVITPLDTIVETVTEDFVDYGSHSWEYFYYTDLKQGFIAYNQIMAGRQWIIKDNTYLQKWEFVSGNKDILGYHCQIAKTSFRGRNYTVYYSPELSIKNGPYKFDGLPGLILGVESDDGYFKILAKGIEFTKIDKEIRNIFSDIETISFEKFKESYENWFQRKTAEVYSEEGTIIYLPKRFEEVLIEN